MIKFKKLSRVSNINIYPDSNTLFFTEILLLTLTLGRVFTTAFLKKGTSKIVKFLRY